MINMPSHLTEDGDIRLHVKEGIRIPIFFQQEDGSPRNMTGAVVAFEMSGGPRILLTVGNTPDEMVLTIPQGALASALNKVREFVVVDETPNPHNVVWGGKVILTGF